MDDMLVCNCGGVQANTVQNYIDDFKAVDKSIDQIAEELEIGLGCGCCRYNGCEKIDISLEDMLNSK